MVYFFSELARTLTLLTLGHLASCMPASPLGWQETLSDGTVSPTLYVRGDESFNFIIDEKGYTVVDGINGEKYYAEKDELTGNVKASRLKVGKADPRKNGLAPAALPDRTVINGMKRKFLNVKGRSDCVQGDCTRRLVEEQSNRKLTTSGTLQTLLVMMRFKDHKNRSLPSSDDYDKLLNGGDVTIAPTGSVRDVYLESSYGKLLINATAYGWVDLPETEAYYADGDYGLTSVFFEAVDFALGIINNDETFHFRDFDRNNDGLIDSIIFTHSGYGAEWGGPDCNKVAQINRIWSHERPQMSRKWCGRENVCVDGYMVTTGLWGTCGSTISRIAVFAHELGHFLGLHDMYDGVGLGRGVGSYSLMGNCWGFDGSQLHPPMLDAWSRIKLGWVVPTLLQKSGIYSLNTAVTSNAVYKIDYGYPQGEYLLLENRQPGRFETDMPQGGLAIWHIDESAGINAINEINEGYPGQTGWPTNGNHYAIALLQADGLYQLEKGIDQGDRGDMWQGNGNFYLGPSNSITQGPFPNTDSYKGGLVKQTGFAISSVSDSSDKMAFYFALPGDSAPQPTAKPTLRPTLKPTSKPTVRPTLKPTSNPTMSPTSEPTNSPSEQQSIKPSTSPTSKPSIAPTRLPSDTPSVAPSGRFSKRPSPRPSGTPSIMPTDVIPQTKGAIAGSASRLEGHIKKVVLEHVAIALFVLSALIAFLWIWICCRKSRKRMSTIAPVTTTGTSVARPWWKMEDIYSSNAGPSQLWRKEENDSSNAGPSIPDNITNDRHVSSSPGISANDEGGSSTNGSFLHNINLFSTSDGDIESKFSLADHLPWKREVMPGSLNKRQKYDIAIPEIGSARFVGAGGGMDTVVEEGGNSGVPSRNINGSEIQSNSVDHAWVWWSDVMNYVSHWTQHEETPSQG